MFKQKVTLILSNTRKLNRILSLFYIQYTIVYTYTITNLPSSLYILYKTNILLLYYIILFVSESSIFFFVLYDYITCDYHVTGVTFIHNITSYPLSKSKNKEKRKTNIKINKKENK